MKASATWKNAERRKPSHSKLAIEGVGGAEPVGEFGIDVGRGRDLNAVSDAIFLGEAARVDEAGGEAALVTGEAETEIDAFVGGRLELREDVFAVERNDGFAGARFDIRTERFAECKKFIEERAETGFLTSVLVLDIFDGGGQVLLWRVLFPALSIGAFRDPPGGVSAKVMFRFKPSAASRKIFGTLFFDKSNPFVESAPGFRFEIGDPLLNHLDARVNVVKRASRGFRHEDLLVGGEGEIIAKRIGKSFGSFPSFPPQRTRKARGAFTRIEFWAANEKPQGREGLSYKTTF